MTRILAGIPKYKEGIDERGTSNSERLLTFVLLLRYTGMRIGDVTRLRSDQIDGQRLFLYTQKTGVAVNTILPEPVVRVLMRIPDDADQRSGLMPIT
jgi:integrase